jgi:hypothetical protein
MAKQWHQLERLDHKALKKLQIEREKQRQLAEKQEERKTYVIIASIVLVALAILMSFMIMINNRKKELNYQKQREELYISQVTEIAGTPEFRKIGLWEPLLDKTEFDEDCSFRTPYENDRVTVTTKLGNTIKAMGSTEFFMPRRILAKDANEIVQELAELVDGELTVTVDMAGRDLLDIKVPGAVVVGKSGLFKVLYDRDKDYGEVVVKNGLVEVKSDLGIATKVSGFYKVVFSSRKVENPVQASVIQYDWR